MRPLSRITPGEGVLRLGERAGRAVERAGLWTKPPPASAVRQFETITPCRTPIFRLEEGNRRTGTGGETVKRVSIADIMRETHLSRATVDRVLNGRGKVHPRTREIVEHALRHLSAARPETPTARADLVLCLGAGMTQQLKAVWERLCPDNTVHDLSGASPEAAADRVEALCADLSRLLIVGACHSVRLAATLEAARGRGKRVIALLSDQPAPARDAFVGQDDRAAGQTAAFLIGRLAGAQPFSVGMVLGDPALRSHEDREIGFRTALRSHTPAAVLAGEVPGEDMSGRTRSAVAALLQARPQLGALYAVGGGTSGLVEAVREAGRTGDLLVVVHEVSAHTARLLREGGIDFVVAGDPALAVEEALRLSAPDEPVLPRDARLLEVGVYTRHNIPRFMPEG